MRAAALAASQPAWPPPMTMTSNDFLSVVMAATSTPGWQKPEGVSRETSDLRDTRSVSRETDTIKLLLIG
jgi:hypothetical protein